MQKKYFKVNFQNLKWLKWRYNMPWMNGSISESIYNVYSYTDPLNYFKASKVTTTPTNRLLNTCQYNIIDENVIEIKNVDDLIDMLDIKIRNEFGGVNSAHKNYDMIKYISKLDKIKIELLKKLNDAI